MAVDMAPYSRFYQSAARKIAAENQKRGAFTTVVEAGVRYGCSARILLDALQPFQDWQLILIDPFPKHEALELSGVPGVVIYQQKAEEVAPLIPDESISLMHYDIDCDGTHPLEVTYKVLLAFWPKLRLDATLIFHDATSHFPGVLRIVKELESSGWKTTYCLPQEECPISAPAACERRAL